MPENKQDDAAEQPPPEALRGEVVRQVPAVPARRRLPRDLAAVRDRLAQLAQNPAAVAAATVATGLAVNVIREAVKGGTVRRSPAATPVVLSGYVVHHVHVIHSVVHHHVAAPGRPIALPPHQR